MQSTTTSTSEPKLSYVDALREASEWLVEQARVYGFRITPAGYSFISWYAWNARRYTLDSAWGHWFDDGAAPLVLREGEGPLPSPELRGERVLYGPDEQGRPTVLASGSRSIPEGVVLWGGEQR